MKTEIYASANLPDGAEITYSLLTAETSGRIGCELYGVEVRMGEETVTRPNLSASRASVGLLLDKLVRGCVTPVTADDIIEDYYI
ncbi:MAG: DUF6514 family protein [Oscillospiraceae bacterium]|jgi:hypothetical protein|nr:DUF6514 family protein [Oscillospiraceae bacterium]